MTPRSCCAALALALCASTAPAAPAYRLTKTVPLGAPDRWDYVTFDAATRRVYIAHGDRVTLVDPASGAIVGQVEGIAGGTHGNAVSTATGEGFTDDGKAGTVIAYDLKTLKIRKTIPAAADADAIAADTASGHLFVIEGDPKSITVVDPATDAAVATIDAGEKLEFAVSDDAGALYVAGEEKGDIVKVGTRTNRVAAHWPVPGCTSPHGLAIDKVGHRLFMGCANSVMPVIDTRTGHTIVTLPIGKGNDAVAFDPVRKRVLSSNGIDGTVTVYQQAADRSYKALGALTTKVSARTMSLDPQSGRLFVAAADTDPNPVPGGRPKIRPGTLALLMFDPID